MDLWILKYIFFFPIVWTLIISFRDILLIEELHCYVSLMLIFYTLIEFSGMMVKVFVSYMSSVGIKFNDGSTKYLMCNCNVCFCCALIAK